MMPAMRAAPSTSPFLALPATDHRQRLRLHRRQAFGDGDRARLVPFADIDHVRLAVWAPRCVSADRLFDIGSAEPDGHSGLAKSSARVAAVTS